MVGLLSIVERLALLEAAIVKKPSTGESQSVWSETFKTDQSRNEP